MNTQRWITLGIVVLIAACLVTSNLWLPRLLPDEEATPTATLSTALENPVEGEATEAPEMALTMTAEPTLDPVVAEILSYLEVEELGPGIEPFITRAGSFTVIDQMHRGEGIASIYQISEEQRVLRLFPFSVTSGPDLRVILSQHEAPRTSTEALLPTYLDLGSLKSIEGAQNYEIPAGESLALYKSVVIYSTSLNIVYSTATLEDVRGQ
jgi:hypothetical protein